MTKLPNERHELYAQHRARGFAPSKAGLAAGYAQGSSTISELEKTPEVMTRVDELLEEQRTKKEQNRAAAIEAAKVVGNLTGQSKAWVMQKLAEVAALAMSDGEYKDANEALKLIGEEFGMFKGGSADDNDGATQVTTVNLDAIEAITGHQMGDTATLIPAPLIREEAPVAEVSEDALKLIQGHSKRKPLAEARQLSTGSETDVALNGEADLDEEAEAGWTKVDPKTSPEDLYRMAMDGVAPSGETPKREPEADGGRETVPDKADLSGVPSWMQGDDDTPPRRSRS